LQSIVKRLRPAPLASFVKKALGLNRMVVATDQGRFWIDPISSLGVYLTESGQYEQEIRHVVETFLRPGSIFVDLGANEGYFTVIGGKRVGPTGRVVAIEPQERLLPVIQENLRLNAIGCAKVLNIAITDKPGTAAIYLFPDTNTGASGLSVSTKYSLPTQQVETKRLVEVFDEEFSGPIDLMKVDIEGFEYEALMGSPELFQQRRVRALAVELHPTQLAARNKSPDDITRMLEENGYTIRNDLGTDVWIAPS
jgi:FkbM family methyltransferase